MPKRMKGARQLSEIASFSGLYRSSFLGAVIFQGRKCKAKKTLYKPFAFHLPPKLEDLLFILNHAQFIILFYIIPTIFKTKFVAFSFYDIYNK